ncbi:unnamed protein product [Didymodactylos carnosus]|uniref:Uncharacterized protein n=1 Tax=Didymodactylos carnosus TaxID=1234261 RepID=A0A816GLY4_9BILA|nr:unnamed protein product [Didymodactylos carnosus]CAF4664083.1 unnamed protein product [Didymodactylos carnosus]
MSSMPYFATVMRCVIKQKRHQDNERCHSHCVSSTTSSTIRQANSSTDMSCDKLISVGSTDTSNAISFQVDERKPIVKN